MKRRTIWFIFVLIIIFSIYLNVAYGGYYRTPEEALENRESKNTSVQYIIETIWVNDEPIIFYVNEKNQFCDARFSIKQIGGEMGYKSSGASYFKLDINSEEIIPVKWNIKIENDGNYDKVFYGISKSNEIYSIKINGKSPIIIPFEMGGKDYDLWYIVGSYELDEPIITLE